MREGTSYTCVPLIHPTLKNLEIVCSMEVSFVVDFDVGHSFKVRKSMYTMSFVIIQQQFTYKGSNVNIGWLRGTLVCDNSVCKIPSQL